ncbi:uncharacterized protein LOC26535024 [Drosophila yakuba]|uniref:Uncharacterized protein n=1 Tax=Drosophila yakuba TaxID=7245 RepID=A0A0R1DZV0_DROYA|nr:uncharacterized protein LOC26535024 [Drosophila yakuba]KRK00897.1 uncharacterized protein Dyak_GE27843 [Drosophila yakuba]
MHSAAEFRVPREVAATKLEGLASLAQSRNSSAANPHPGLRLVMVMVMGMGIPGAMSCIPYSRIPYPGQVGSGDECGIIACCFCQWHCHTTADVVGRKHAAANEWAWDSAGLHTAYAVLRTQCSTTSSSSTSSSTVLDSNGSSSHTSNCNQHLGNKQLRQNERKRKKLGHGRIYL